MSDDLLDQLGRGHGAITASAGTGKTHTLLQLVLREARLGAKLDRILAVTFTRKGTLELRERIRAGLAEAMREAGTEEEVKRLREARRELERATITTIHGFCQEALQERAFESGQPLETKLAPGSGLASRAFQIALRKGLVGAERAVWERLVADPGPARLEAGVLEMLPELERLGPTEEDLIERIGAFDGATVLAQLAEAADSLKPQSRKPLLELRAQIEETLREAPDAWEAARAAKNWKRPAKPDSVWWQAIPEPTRAAIEDLQDFPWISLGLQVLAKATRAESEALKAAEGVLDYGDLIRQLRLALEAPGGEALAARLAERHDLCLLDEAQDTSEDQWAILWRLFNREGKRLVLVGDAKQAIFGFQGGDLPAFDRARRELAAHGGRAVSLRQNWRAVPAVIEACNAILGLGGEACLLREPADPVAVFSDEDLKPALACPHPPSWDEAMPALVALPVPHHGDVDSAARASAAAIADQLLALKAAGPRFRLRGETEGRPFSWRDAFLLVHTAREADLLASVLREKGVPFVQHKARGLYEGDAAEDLHALLMALEDPSDPGRRMRAFLTPFFGLRLEDAVRARELAEDHLFVSRLRAWARDTSLDRILDESGVLARLLAEEAGQRRVADLLHLVELLQRAAGPGEGPADHARRLAAWAEGDLRLEGEEEAARRLEQEGDAASILTLHAAKGLEAPVVALFGGLSERSSADRVPLRRYHARTAAGWERRVWFGRGLASNLESQVRGEERAELRRLFYVGLTRAQGLLLLPFHEAPPDAKASRSFDASGLPKGPYGLIQSRVPELEAEAWFHRGPLALAPTVASPEPATALETPSFPFDTVKARAWPLRTESFTSLQRRAEAEEGGDPEPDRMPRAEGLPGGAATGVALHAMLEEIVASDFTPRFSDWWAEPRRRWAEGHCRGAGLDPKWAVEAARLAHAGFSHPLYLPGVRPVALCALKPDRLLRELAFLTAAEGGRLTGALDALFEHEGRAFILDWKSNRLAGYGPEELDACMAEDYALQVRVYTLAVLKALAISTETDYEARFGGAVYVFLRGLPEGGVWTARPSWSEVQAWRESLRAQMEAARG
ncbi:MAG TPA: UvrD-helicase domain-containing protein [Holophagaceae bacterium]|nr:UvrD-helicase domain-containing protein [Holophagaceae bacterium]